MMLRKRLALLTAALAAVTAVAGCQGALKPPAQATAPAPTAAAPQAAGTPSAAPPGGVEVALAAISWPTGPAVARVNGTDVPMPAWREEVTRELRLLTAQYQVDWNDKANIGHLPTILGRVLDDMVDRELMRQLAAQQKIAVTDADVQKEIENVRQQVVDGGQYKDMDAFLKANGFTQDKFQAVVRDKLVYDRLSAAEAGMTEVEQVHARHILVADEQKAKEVLDKLAAGESFDSLAKTYSTDAGSKDKGGDLGWFPAGTVVPEFDKAAFALQAGQTSGAVKSDYGYHIIRVDERGVRKLEEPMLTQYREAKFAEWLDAQRQKAKIEKLYTPPPGPTPTSPTPASQP